MSELVKKIFNDIQSQDSNPDKMRFEKPSKRTLRSGTIDIQNISSDDKSQDDTRKYNILSMANEILDAIHTTIEYRKAK